MTDNFDRMRIIRCHLLKYSADKDVVDVLENRVRRHKDNKTIWRDTQLLEKVVSMVEHECQFQSAPSHDKLGHGLFAAHLDDNAGFRSRCVAAVRRPFTP